MVSLVFSVTEHLIKQNIKSQKRTAPDFWTAESWGVKTVLQPARVAIKPYVRNAKNARIWELSPNAHRAQFVLMKNALIYTS